jgi:hypothetical protein
MILLLLAITTQDAGCFPRTGDRLASDDIEVREAAVTDLVKRGAKAVPAIRRAMENATDAELKARLEEALKAITEIRWMTDLDAALRKARKDAKPLLVYTTRGRLDGWS